MVLSKYYGSGEVYADRGGIYYAALFLCVICAGVFALQQFANVTEAILLIKDRALIEPWRYVTSLFAHGSMGHLLSNLFALGVFGSVLEGRIGSRRLLYLFFISGVVINLFSPYERSLGASGAIFALLGALVALRPLMIVWINGLPMPMILAGFIWLIQDVLGIFTPNNVANLAHIGGLVIGAFVGWKWRPIFADRPKRKARRDKEAEAEVAETFDEWEKRYMK